MFSMPKMEMVEFEVESIMAASTSEEATEATTTRRTYTTNPNAGIPDEF